MIRLDGVRVGITIGSVKTITVFNRKGGAGKTVVSILLSSYLVAAGRKILVVDLDPQASLSAYYARTEGIDPSSAPGSYGVMSGEALDESALIRIASTGMGILAATPGLGAIETTATTVALQGFLARFEGEFDCCIIDTGGNWSTLVQAAFQASSFVIIPTLLPTDDMENALWSYGRTRAYLGLEAGILLNQWKGIRQDEETIELFRDDLEGKLMKTRIPQSSVVRRYTDTAEKLTASARSKQQLFESVDSLAREVFGGDFSVEQF